MSEASTKKANHLLREKSPYLQQHAYNPVDWYPWGEEAFSKAKREDKPILLSIGYSTCHWCHVMERESFEDPKIGELMNQTVVAIKLDREERPDVDKIYMTAVQALTGSGGWPLNVFLTHDLKPFYGGTYYPPESKWGHPGWTDVITQVGQSWRDTEQRKKIIETADHLTAALKQYTSAKASHTAVDPQILTHAFDEFTNAYEPEKGGFSRAPKFPMPVNVNFLLRYYARSKEARAKEMALHTLREMAKGGIYDHIGGGFARYSTDPQWHVPHFEKMLYDNAQLAINYLDAFQMTREELFQRVARETLDYISRDMTSPEGGFYSAEDADSFPTAASTEKQEGAFYVWEKTDIDAVLGADKAKTFCEQYGVTEKGNVASDPHGEFTNKNVLYLAKEMADLTPSKQLLFQARLKRPRPHLDDKVISGWNGLMISAYARGFQVLGDPKYLAAAQKGARFLQQNLYDASKKTLYRRWRGGERQGLGIADDYAFVVQALLDLYEADFNPSWLAWAEELHRVQQGKFWDEKQGGFFMTALDQDENLLLRVKEDQDNVEPAASSVGAMNALRLAIVTDKESYRALADQTFQAFGEQLKASPRALPAMMSALDFATTEPRQVVIAGAADAADTQALFKTTHEFFIPVKAVLLANAKSPQKPIQGKAAAYLCRNFVCKQPTTDPSKLREFLQELQSK